MNKEEKICEIVKKKFTEYLTAKKCRKTPERYAILNLIYTDQRHFDMDSLYDAMNKSNFRVSRGTLYNTMQLLLDCNLVLKHQFGKNISVYERAYHNDFHHHLICTNCQKIQEYKDDSLKSAIKSEKIKHFTPTHYSLYIYGLCSHCTKQLKSKKIIHNS
jgi:Fur family ferric uptake transcriptional regulator